ncbi:MAG: T9SS type A sorting domain-containing protein [Bacteroidia bacterium]|nr:T9SS type A sorting domain-containing protein [Bacteroidia bacterium]
MKLILSFILLTTPFFILAQDTPFSATEKCGFTSRQMVDRRSDDTKLDIIFQNLKLDPNPANGELKGSALIIYSPKTTSSQIVFGLEKSLTVDSAFRNGAKFNITRQRDKIIFELLTPLSAGKADTVEIFYSGKPSFDELYYSRSAHKSGNIVATRSEPYGCYYWFPCQNTLSDKIDSLEVTIYCDSIYKGVSNGVLVEVADTGSGRNYYRWKHSYPIAPYLVAIAVSPYDIITDYAPVNNGNDSLRIQNFVYPFYKETAKTLVKQTIPIMTLYDSLFGPYPFMREQYGHAQFHHGGGMEHQTMSFMGSFSFDLIAHELMHQWFGDKITCGTWQDLWLNEGFATYGNMLCYQYLKNDSLWKQQLQTNIDQVLSKPNGSVFAKDTSKMSILFDQRLVYMKGAMVIHMLRFVCGDSAFYAGIRNYLADSNLAYNFARQGNLKSHLEQSSGLDLDLFFEQWIMREGFPTFTIHYTQNTDRSLQISIIQETSDPSVNFFDIPVPIMINGKNGEKEYRILKPTTNLFNVKIQLGFEVESVQFDPEKWLLARGMTIKEKSSKSPSLLLFPNPNNGNLSVLSFDYDIISYRIMSAEGKTVLYNNFEIPFRKGENLLIDIGSLSDGFYIFESTYNEGKQITKFIKQ